MKKIILGVSGLVVTGLLLGACGNESTNTKDGKESITFINHKTDWETNGKWKEYIQQFNEKNPDIEVNIQTITDYAGQIKTRMNSKEYGDVLMIPSDVKPQDYKNFFEPLGDKKELSEKYLGLNDRSFEGVSYGLPSQMNATGFVVNKKVFEDAGITSFPKTEEEFLEALQSIKKSNKEITPLYTNYASGWTLVNWDFVRSSVAGNPNFTNELTTNKAPFSKDQPLEVIYKVLYDASKEKLIENDPTTSDWEQSKVDLANGKIGAMLLGSWAIPQVKDANKDNAENIVFQAFPATTKDGKQYMNVAGDYNYGINVNSEHKKAARTFIDWLVNDSDYAKDNGGLPTVKGAVYPDSLKDSQASGVELMEENPAPSGQESLFSDINDQSQIGLGTTDSEKQRIIDAGIGNSKESFEDIMKDLNTRWSDSISTIKNK